MSDSVISFSSIGAALAPYLVAGLGAIVTGALSLVAAAAHRYVGVTIQDNLIKEADDYLGGLARKAVAAASDNLARTQIHVGSSIVQTLVAEALAHGPDVLARLGWGPDVIAARIAAAFGGLQAQMTVVEAAPAGKAPAAAPTL